jgi:hypothetical protein
VDSLRAVVHPPPATSGTLVNALHYVDDLSGIGGESVGHRAPADRGTSGLMVAAAMTPPTKARPAVSGPRGRNMSRSSGASLGQDGGSRPDRARSSEPEEMSARARLSREAVTRIGAPSISTHR